MKRIFIPQVFIGQIAFDSQVQQYLKKTLRFKPGTPCNVFDGIHEAHAIYYENYFQVIKIIPKTDITYLKLAIAAIKKENLEWAIEKATELGVKHIVLLKTQRVQPQHHPNLPRLKKIIINACQQCGRISIPDLEWIQFDEFVQNINPIEWCFGSTKASKIALNLNIKGTIIGPEGGWTNIEEEKLTESPCPALTLNTNILRTETAAITALNFIHLYHTIHSS